MPKNNRECFAFELRDNGLRQYLFGDHRINRGENDEWVRSGDSLAAQKGANDFAPGFVGTSGYQTDGNVGWPVWKIAAGLAVLALLAGVVWGAKSSSA